MEVIKLAGRALGSKLKGRKWVEEEGEVVVGVQKEIKRVEESRAEDEEPVRQLLSDIRDKYKPALDVLAEMDVKLRERTVREYDGGEGVKFEDGGELVFAEVWDYTIKDVKKVPKEYKTEVVDVKKVREAVRAGLRKIPGVEITTKAQLRILTK